MARLKDKTPLRKAIDHLVAAGKIDSDADLAEIFKLSKGTISTYINTKPGKEFKERFEQHFKIKLDDFSNNVPRGTIVNDTEPASYGKDEYIKALIDIISAKNELIELLKKENEQLKKGTVKGAMVPSQEKIR